MSEILSREQTDRPTGDEVLVRRLAYSDLPNVISIERRSFPTPWSLAMFVLELSKPSGICLTASRGGEPAGYGVGSRYDQVWHLMNVAVSPEHRTCGVSGALFAYAYLGTVEPEAYNLDLSFRILFMVIIGGAGTVLGSFLGSAFIVLTPIALNIFVHFLDNSVGLRVPASAASNLEVMVFGALIIFFLIVEPNGLARMWSTGKEKLRLWPFPH